MGVRFSEEAEHDIGRLERCWICCQWPVGWAMPGWLVRWHLDRMRA